MKKLFLPIIIIIVTLVFFFAIPISQRNAIKEKVEEAGGHTTSIDYKVFDLGPFYYRGKNDSVYKFTYVLDGKKKTGWVRFSLVDKWIMDEK